MFDAENRLQVWNERYREMYGIDPKQIWTGCTVRDLLKARIAAGTFPLDPEKYDSELREAIKQGKVYVITVELADGRTIAVVNQPIDGGGWVATHEDISERMRAQRELDKTRAFLDTIIDNVPTPIIVKSLPDMRYLLVNKRGRKIFRQAQRRGDRQDRARDAGSRERLMKSTHGILNCCAQATRS